MVRMLLLHEEQREVALLLCAPRRPRSSAQQPGQAWKGNGCLVPT